MPIPRLCRGVALACILIAASFSSDAAPKRPASHASGEGGGSKHCLWRVTNAKAPFYLLGSFHSLREQDYPLPGVIDQAIAQANQFYFEFDPKQDDTFARKLDAAMKLPRGVVIKDKIHPKTWDYLRTTARGGGTDWMHMRAWAIAMSELDYPARVQLSGAFGVDYYVEKKARARNCPLRGLESVDDHVNVFAGMSDIESEAYLLEAIVYWGQRDANAARDISAWRNGNTEAIAASEDPTVREAPGLPARFLESRNMRWIPVIENAIKSGKPTMIVAGAGHFSGPHSVLNMLRARGYQIEQL